MKKKKKVSQKKPNTSVRLSQCMIVKNEEKNIERALGWAKNVAFEQIVVDTGSTDRTVELAEKMGAKVYHFEWINDFAAAKNYAMDLAKGNWIAILDADEYMTPEDAGELLATLKKIQADPVRSKECDAITCTFVNLDENGNTIFIISHQRVFRNKPHLRFKGRIHETININHNHINIPGIRIIHTGYTQAVYTDTKKLDRNVTLLRKELDDEPDNPNIMLYLADSIKGSGTPEALAESEELFQKALNSEVPSKALIKQLAYNFLIPRYARDNEKHDEAMRLCNRAIIDLPGYLDYYYYRAVLNNINREYKTAQDDLIKCEELFMSSDGIPTTQIMMPSPLRLFYQLLLSARGLGDTEGISRNSTIIQIMLKESKKESTVIGQYIRALLIDGITEEAVLDELAEIYDLNDPKDLLFIARASKESGAVEFTRNIMKKIEQILGDGS